MPLGPGLLQLSQLWGSCVSSCLEVFVSSCLSRPEAHTLKACVGAPYTARPAHSTPMPARRQSYSTFPEPLSQSPTDFAHRLTPFYTLKVTVSPRLNSSRLPFFLSLPHLFSKPCLNFSFCSTPVPGPMCYSTGDQKNTNLQISPHSSESYSPLPPADQACRCGAHLLATSLSLRHLKPTATHSNFRLLTTGSTTPPACSPSTGAASPLRPPPLWSPLYHSISKILWTTSPLTTPPGLCVWSSADFLPLSRAQAQLYREASRRTTSQPCF